MISGTAVDAHTRPLTRSAERPLKWESEENLANSFLTIGEGVERGATTSRRPPTSTSWSLSPEANGKYFVAGADGKLTATADTKEDASQFEAYSWGQDGAYNYKCLDNGDLNGKWLTFSVTQTDRRSYLQG